MQSLGKAGTDFPLPSLLPVHKRAHTGTQTRGPEPVTGTHVPPNMAAASLELCGALGSDGSEAGTCLSEEGGGSWHLGSSMTLR